uniref:Uncharacterized protein n=1 Tax=Helianthus annuus TaxID=4232 RepID=A0A251U6I1_HELAN
MKMNLMLFNVLRCPLQSYLLFQKVWFRQQLYLNNRRKVDIGNGINDKKLYVKCAMYIDGAPFWLPMKTRIFWSTLLLGERLH